MKYTTFRGLLIGGGLLLVLGAFGSCLLCAGSQALSPKPPPPVATVVVPSAAPLPTPAAAPTVTAVVFTDSMPVTDVHRAVLAASKQNISGDKGKDALRGQAYKVNLYKDPGQTRVNRLKLDLDRDDKWDEKWTLEDGGKVKRQIAPADDENYTLEYRLEGEYWRKKP
ncbi:MAG: hypothetical protein IPM35_37425 [Myxococcales bacterium]|nr:hypothetical protein [Myxococcales bacterium]